MSARFCFPESILRPTTRPSSGRPRILPDRVGLIFPLTKQESQTLVSSFSVKSILRLGSISTPHFPHRSSAGSATICLLLDPITKRKGTRQRKFLCAGSNPGAHLRLGHQSRFGQDAGYIVIGFRACE